MSAGLAKRIRDAVPKARALDGQAATNLAREFKANVSVLTQSATQRHVADDAPEAVRAWLRGLPVDPSGEALVLWLADHAGASMSVTDLIDAYDNLWFPSADDVYVRAADGSWSLFFDHEEVFSFLKH